MDRDVTKVKVKEIATLAPNLVTVSTECSLQDCLNKMNEHEIRHLPIVDEEMGEIVGMLSIKDCVRALLEEKESMIETMSNLFAGKGGTFVVD